MDTGGWGGALIDQTLDGEFAIEFTAEHLVVSADEPDDKERGPVIYEVTWNNKNRGQGGAPQDGLCGIRGVRCARRGTHVAAVGYPVTPAQRVGICREVIM